jgi:general secretion pathway protein J
MNRSRRGFTLIEVLVALFVLALMAMMAWRGITALVSSREVAQTHLDASMKLQTVLQQFEQDLQAVRTTDSGSTSALSFDGATLRIVRRQAEGLQLVAWTLRQGRLYRWAGPIVQQQAGLNDAFQQSAQLGEQDGRLVATLDGLSDWQMYFFRGTSWSNAQASADLVQAAAPAASAASAAAVQAQQLPTGVRMVLGFAPGGGLQGRLTKTVVIGTYTPT